MSRHLRLPVALILSAAIMAALLFLLPAQDAKAPEQTGASVRGQAQEGQSVAATGVAGGFQDRLAAEALGATALAFLPDGRLLVTDRSGRVLVRQPGEADTTEALNIRGSVCSNSERGLLGIAVDPNFENNGYVYLYYTYKKYDVCPEKEPQQNNNPVNRVARFVMEGDTISPNPPEPTPNDGPGEVLINNIPSPNGNHNAGDLHFGNDGKLYVSTGDGACDYNAPTRCQPVNDAGRDRNVLLGKILRINPDGTIPDDNPYANLENGVRCGTLTQNNARGGSAAAPGKVCAETYARGFRNPFRFAMNPDADETTFRVNDVGWRYIEEVSIVSRGGKDYGWNCVEGKRTNSTRGACNPLPKGTVKPMHQYRHRTGCSSITGAAFVPNNAGWPASYRDAYLYGDYVCGKIFKLTPETGGGYTRKVFASGMQGGPVSLAYGPDGALYYTTYAGGGQVRRIVNSGAPIASIEATPSDPETGKTYGPAPLTVEFGSTSTDPQDDTLTFEWDFDYTDRTFTRDATGTDANHEYAAAGRYTVALRATDSGGNSDTTQMSVYAGNEGPPRPVIESPGPGATFEVDQQITLTGSATDDGRDVALKWEVIRHHTAPNAHTHPSILDPADGTGESVTFSAPGPEDLGSTDPRGNYLEVRLTATDSQGLSKTVTQDLKPETTSVGFETVPDGFYVLVNGEKVRAPRTLLAWEGSNLDVLAPQQGRDGKQFVFRSWSDGATGNRRTIEVPENDTGYTATFGRK